MAARKWTLAQRQQQARAIHGWQPWEQSTGPRTPEGKRVVSGNAYDGAVRFRLRNLSRTIGQQQDDLKKLLRGAA
jgi:hypothetical protein